LQAAIKEKYGVTADLKEGYGGVFDVTIDSALVYSKHTAYRFPEHTEIFQKIEERRK
jgi:selT/selW/selH-like putative selenoprotein